MGRPVKIVDLATKMIEVMGARGVRLKYVGLRPGEKLHETLSEESEQRAATDHHMIFRLVPKNPPSSDLLEAAEEWPSSPSRATTRRPSSSSGAPSRTIPSSRVAPCPKLPDASSGFL
jgi:FlaA1/EpsC-like NDP-sugar epimerase